MRRLVLIVLGLIAVVAILGRHDANAADGDPPPEDFVCPSGCDCEIPKAGMVFCISNPFICSSISDYVECFSTVYEPIPPAYIAMNTGQKPSGCKMDKSLFNCTEESFECYRLGYCFPNLDGTCSDWPANQGPAQQSPRKKPTGC